MFELDDERTALVSNIFERMKTEFQSKYKYDLIRNLILELLHFALKLEPSLQLNARPINATRRIASYSCFRHFLTMVEKNG